MWMTNLRGGVVKVFYGDMATPSRTGVGIDASDANPPSPLRALIAVYDGLTAPPRVEKVTGSSARDLIETLAFNQLSVMLSRRARGCTARVERVLVACFVVLVLWEVARIIGAM